MSTAIVLGAWILVLGWLLESGAYTRFLSSQLWFVPVAGLVLGIAFLLAVCFRSTAKSCCGCDHDHHHGHAHDHGHDHAHGPSGPYRWLGVAIFTLPLLYIPASPTSGLNSFAFEHRSLNLSFFTPPEAPPEISPEVSPEVPAEALPEISPEIPPEPSPEPTPESPPLPSPDTITPSVAALPQGRPSAEPQPVVPAPATPAEPQLPPVPVTLAQITDAGDRYDGQLIETEGMVFRGERVPAGSIVAFRFVVNCCAADAMPVGVQVTGKDLNLDRYERDSWVRVTGKLMMEVHEGFPRPRIEAKSVTQIEQPANPYLEPDGPFGGF